MLSASLAVTLRGTDTKVFDQGTASFPFAHALSQAFADGTGASQLNTLFVDTRTLAASTNEDLDLFGSTFTDWKGDALAFATLKAVLVYAATTNTNNVVVSRPASNGVALFDAASDAISLGPGGLFLFMVPGTGKTVTTGTADLINFANSGAGTDVVYTVMLLGTK